jgi:hypothetical protein
MTIFGMRHRWLALLAITPILGDCVEGKYPFLMVQLCLRDAESLALFTRSMQSIAQAENMTFHDGSEITVEILNEMDKENRVHDPRGPVIHLDIGDNYGIGVTAANLGLPGYQVALGFSEGSRPEEARRFARRVVDQLSARWQIQAVPDGEGAQPLQNCNG